MKVVFSANTSWYLYNFRVNTILAIIEQGHDVLILAPRDGYSEKLVSLGCSFFPVSIDQTGVNPYRDILTCLSFFRCYRRIKPSLIFNFTPKNNIYSTLASSLLDIPSVNNISGLGKLFSENSISSRVVRFLYRRSQKKARKVFFQNEEDRSFFVDNGYVDRAKTDRLYGSGIDLMRFKASPLKDDGVVKFLLVARLLMQKGIYEYAEAAERLKKLYGDKVEFRLLGNLDDNNPNSIDKKHLQQWVQGGVINYLGVSDQVECFIREADCIVLPSFYREGVPKSLLEGLGSGRAIITTDNIGCRETVVDGVNGFICRPRSVSCLVDKLSCFVELSSQGKVQMGFESRKLAESKFDEKMVINSYLNVVKSVESDLKKRYWKFK